MARKTDTHSRGKQAQPEGDPIRDSASQIWLAGLGAFAKAQEEGTRMFDALVREGTAIQRRTQEATEETLTEAAQRISSMASEISSRATGQWDRLETLFEDRVDHALERLGVARAADLSALTRRIEALERQSARPAAAPPRKPRSASRKKTPDAS